MRNERTVVEYVNLRFPGLTPSHHNLQPVTVTQSSLNIDTPTTPSKRSPIPLHPLLNATEIPAAMMRLKIQTLPSCGTLVNLDKQRRDIGVTGERMPQRLDAVVHVHAVRHFRGGCQVGRNGHVVRVGGCGVCRGIGGRLEPSILAYAVL